MAKKITIKSLKRGSVRYFLILTRDFGRARQSLRKHFTLPAQKIRLRLADAREMSTEYFGTLDLKNPEYIVLSV